MNVLMCVAHEHDWLPSTHYEQNVRVWLDTVRRRDTCSQLLTIPDAAYEAGVRRLEHELADGSTPPVRADHVCFVTIRGEKRLDRQ